MRAIFDTIDFTNINGSSLLPLFACKTALQEAIRPHQNDWTQSTDTEQMNTLTDFVTDGFIEPFDDRYQG